MFFQRFDSTTNKGSDSEYRTKLEFEINGSENVVLDFLTPSRNKFDEVDDDDDADDDTDDTLPKVIELDGYRPTMSLVMANRSIETIQDLAISNVNKTSTALLHSQQHAYLLDEFCRFYKLRPFMTWLPPFKSNKTYRLRNNLVYFTHSSINEFSLQTYI